MAPDKSVLASIGSELKINPPSVLKNTEKKFGIARAKKQKTAILLSKARKVTSGVRKNGY